MSALRSIKWPYAVIAVLAVAAASYGVLRPQLPAAFAFTQQKKPGATARVKQSPPPTLFTDAAIADLGRQVAAQHKKADDLFAHWKAQHGTTRDDKAFAAWAAQQVPAPPPPRPAPPNSTRSSNSPRPVPPRGRRPPPGWSSTASRTSGSSTSTTSAN